MCPFEHAPFEGLSYPSRGLYIRGIELARAEEVFGFANRCYSISKTSDLCVTVAPSVNQLLSSIQCSRSKLSGSGPLSVLHAIDIFTTDKKALVIILILRNKASTRFLPKWIQCFASHFLLTFSTPELKEPLGAMPLGQLSSALHNSRDGYEVSRISHLTGIQLHRGLCRLPSRKRMASGRLLHLRRHEQVTCKHQTRSILPEESPHLHQQKSSLSFLSRIFHIRSTAEVSFC